MKILDDKGRLFGKINLIDFMLVIFLFSLIPLFYYGYKISKNSKTKNAPVEFMQLEINAKFTKLNYETLKLIAAGDKELDEQDNETIGEIVWLGKSKPFTISFDLGSQETFFKEISGLNDLYARIKIRAEARKGVLYYKGRQVTIGSPLDFRTKKYVAVVVPVTSAESKRAEFSENEEVYLNVIFKDLSDEELNLVSVGDKQVNEKGEIIAEVLKVGKTENNTLEINLGSGNFVTAEQPTKKEVSVKLRLEVRVEPDGLLYFNNQLLSSNSKFTFKAGKYAVRCQPANILSNEKWIEVRVRFPGIIPELARVISEGDTEKELGVKLAGRLKSIVSNKVSETRVLSIEQDKFITIPQPNYREIEAKLNLLCSEKGGVFYYKNYPVKVGNIVTFTTDLYSISGQIVDMDGI